MPQAKLRKSLLVEASLHHGMKQIANGFHTWRDLARSRSIGETYDDWLKNVSPVLSSQETIAVEGEAIESHHLSLLRRGMKQWLTRHKQANRDAERRRGSMGSQDHVVPYDSWLKSVSPSPAPTVTTVWDEDLQGYVKEASNEAKEAQPREEDPDSRRTHAMERLLGHSLDEDEEAISSRKKRSMERLLGHPTAYRDILRATARFIKSVHATRWLQHA